MTHNNYKRIFILNSIGIGDLIFAIPFMKALRKGMPDSEITLAVSSAQLPIAQQLEGMVTDKLHLHQHKNRVLNMLYWLQEVPHLNPDLFIEFSGEYRYAITGYFSHASRIIHPPHEYAKKVAQLFYSERFPKPASRHRVDIYLSYLSALGIPHNEVSFEFPIPQQIEERAIKVIDDYKLRGRKLVGVVPDSSQIWKDWTLRSLRQTIDTIVNDLDHEVVVFGKTPVHDLDGCRIMDLRGKTSLLLDAYLLRYSGLFDVVIGVDTGMMHIAGSVSSNDDGSYGKGVNGNRTISLIGATDPSMYKPYDPTGRFNLVVHPNLDGVRMDPLGYVIDKHRGDYMGNLTPRMIVEKIERHLRDKVP